MAQIVDRFGKPIDKAVLTEPQTSRLGWVTREFADHPSRGLTPIKLHRILEDAELGNLEAQSDLFTDMEEKDGHIFAEMSKRKRALLTLDWRVEPPRNASAAEKALAEEVNEWLLDLEGFEDLLLDALDGIGHGFAAQEIEWGRMGKLWYPQGFTLRPQRWFKTLHHDGNALRLRNGTPEGEELLPFGWVTHVHKAKSGYLTRGGLHRILAWPYPTQSQFYNVTASSAGGTDPELRIGIEDGKVVIWLGPTASDFYCASFAISVLAPNSPEDYLIGWSSASEAYTGGIVVSYINRFGSAVFDGNVRASSSLFLGWDDTCNLADLRTNSLTPIGYRKLPGGDIEQWGRINIGSVSGSAYAVGSPKNIDITFPIAFPTECFNVQVTAHPSDDGVTANSGRGSGTLRTISKTGATIGVEPHMDGYSANFYLHWKARGK